MAIRRLSPEEQAAFTERLREFIRHERERGIPTESILQACHDCGLVPIPEMDEDEEIPGITTD